MVRNLGIAVGAGTERISRNMRGLDLSEFSPTAQRTVLIVGFLAVMAVGTTIVAAVRAIDRYTRNLDSDFARETTESQAVQEDADFLAEEADSISDT